MFGMSFFRKKRKTKKADLNQGFISQKKIPFYHRKKWKVFLIVLGIFLITGLSFVYYLVKTGSGIFANGLSASSLVKALTGSGDELQGTSDDRVNILLLGMGGSSHPGGLLSDTIIVLSIKPSTNEVAMLSIPRDLYVAIDGHGSDKINSAFSSGYNDYMSKSCTKKSQSDCVSSAMAAGANLSTKTVQNVTGLTIPYYFIVEFDGFEKIIDKLGGIDVYVDNAIYDPSFPSDDMVNYTTFQISAGQHHMDGATALKYARSRETTSDFDRAARQQKVILAIKDKAANLNLLTDSKQVLEIFSAVSNTFYTNFSATEIKTLLGLIKNVDTGNAITKVLTTDSDGPLMSVNNGTYYLKTKTGDYSAIRSIAKNIFETKRSADIGIINSAKLTTSQIETITKEIEKNSDLDLSIVSTSVKSTVAKTVIYDYTGGAKSKVLSYLKQKFSADSEQKTKTSSSSADFVIVIGQDYKAQ